MNELFKDAQQLARRQPELFVAGALAAGFLVGRFFKSSSAPQSSRYNTGSSWQDSYSRGSYTQGRYGQNQYGQNQYGQNQYGSQPGTGNPNSGSNKYTGQSSTPSATSQYPYSDRYKDQSTTRQDDNNTMTHDVPITESEEAYAR